MTDTPDALAIVREMVRLGKAADALPKGSYNRMIAFSRYNKAAVNARPALAAVLARYEAMEAALRKFEAFYPHGINCYLDDAARDARAALSPTPKEQET